MPGICMGVTQLNMSVEIVTRISFILPSTLEKIKFVLTVAVVTTNNIILN